VEALTGPRRASRHDTQVPAIPQGVQAPLPDPGLDRTFVLRYPLI